MLRLRKNTLLAVSVALALAGGSTYAALGGDGTVASPQDELVGVDGKADIIIVLQGEPAAVEYARTLAASGDGAVGRTAAGGASRAAVARLEAQQAEFSTRLLASGIQATELYRVARALNGIAVRMAPENMAAVRRMAGVARVEYLPKHYPTNGSSVPFIGAPSVWQGTPLSIPGLKGEGMTIGIIDTGIDYQHPDFGGTGVLVDYQANDRTIITDQIGGTPIFPTAKVVGGWDFVGDAYTGSNTPAPDPDPMDCNGHGSHVAGTAAGVGVRTDNTPYPGPWDTSVNWGTLKIGPGVAPAAKLYGLRVFGCGGSTGVTVAAIDRATDPNNDGDLSDRLDVINMSLGSNFGLPFDASAAAADNASLTGMMVVMSAGNAADTFFISGSPGSAKTGIATANILDDGLPGPILVNAPAGLSGYKIAGAASFGVAPPLGGLTADVLAVNDNSTVTVPPGGTPAGTLTDGCQTPYVNAAAVAGKIAFVDRGSCGFKLKAYHAQLNGAAGIIIGNIATSGSPTVAPGMADDPTVPAVTIPVVSVNLADANAFRAALAAGTVNATINSGGDTAAGTTSRGPGGTAGANYLKPDLAAPGTSITSAQTGVTCTGAAGSTGCQVANPSGYIPLGAPLVLGGTSMASPHVAGLVALLRQQNPSLSVAQLKALAINTASHDVTLGPGGQLDPYPASRVGSGRVDAPDSATNKILAFDDAEPGLVAVTFNVDVVGTATTTRGVRLQNRTAIIQNVNLDIDTLLDSPGVAFSIVGPTTVAVPAGGSTVVQIQMTADAAQMKRYRDPTMAATQAQGAPAALAALGALPRSYLAEESANLKISKNKTELARVPLYMAHRPHSDMASSATNPPGSPTNGTVALPLSGTGVCTGTAGPGTCTGTFGTTDHVSLVSPFELQYTGTEDTGLDGFANIKYAGINYDSANDVYYFGFATFGAWGTPSHGAFNVCVDNNNDGSYDRLLFNTSLGLLARLMTNTSISGQDVFMSALYDPAAAVNDRYSVAGPTPYVNSASPAQFDTALHNNNVLFVGATAAQLGLTAGGATVRYKIATCPGFNPACSTSALATCASTSANEVAGPFTYNAAARGVATTGMLFNDLPGATLNVTYNEANLLANNPNGRLLLLHHYNSPGNSAQVVALDSLFADDFED